jgi:protein TonB
VNAVGARLQPWWISAALHACVAGLVAILLTSHWHLPSRDVTIDMVEISKPSAPVALTRPKPAEVPKVHQVYGVSRKALTADQGAEVKAGNTLAKAPDNETLNPSDADSLPVPTEDYLVTQMPQLEKEIVIPYPPEVKKRGIQGAVTMDLLIDAGGNVRKVDLVDGPDPELNAAAVSAVMGFKFKPAMLQAKPVAVRIRYAYRFVIRG